MSKKLTKILTICVLAVILPVAIIVTVVCLNNAVTYSLAIEMAGLIENVGNVSVKVNGVEYNENMKFSKNSQVTLSVTSKGYDYKWYCGHKEDISAETQAVSSEANYTIKMSEDKVFTLGLDVINYNVSYDGAEAVSVQYGSQLKVEKDAWDDNTKENEGKIFKGWKIVGTEDSALFTVAEFDSAALTDRNVALESVQGPIVYNVSYDGSEAEKVEYGSVLSEPQNKEDGLKFVAWQNNGKDVTKAEFEKDVDINLTSRNEKVKFKVKYGAEAEAKEVEWGAALEAKGIDSNGDVYNGWTYEKNGKVYTTATFPEAKADAEIELTASLAYNVYDANGSYKQIIIKYSYKAEGGSVELEKDGQPLGSATHTINNNVVVAADGSISLSLDTAKSIIELIEGFVNEPVSGNNNYTLSGIVLKDSEGESDNTYDLDATNLSLAYIIENYLEVAAEDAVNDRVLTIYIDFFFDVAA